MGAVSNEGRTSSNDGSRSASIAKVPLPLESGDSYTTQPKSNVNPTSTTRSLDDATLRNSDHRSDSTSNPNVLTIADLLDGHYVAVEDALRPSVAITNIKHSIVDLSASVTLARPFSAIAIKEVIGSLFICGQISGAAHITGVKGSTLIISSRQVRIHECRNCVMYLRCSSRPIIEDCHSIRFAPLPEVFVRNHSSELVTA